MITRPMLAPNELPTDAQLFFPCMVTPKVDGIRGVKVGGKILSRSFKPIPNEHIRKILEPVLPDGMDGELISGDNFQDCTTGIMTENLESKFKFCIFDYVKSSLDRPYTLRCVDYTEWYCNQDPNAEHMRYLTILVPETVYNIAELKAFEQKCLDSGYEGAMIRAINGRYKCNRCTIREALLYKYKQFDDSEAIIIGYKEQETNENKQKKNALGFSERSHHKAGKRKVGTLGTLLVRDIKTGIEFGIGTGLGLTKELRQKIWDNRDEYLGKIIKFKYQVHGVKDKPRCPSFQGFRHEDDMS